MKKVKLAGLILAAAVVLVLGQTSTRSHQSAVLLQDIPPYAEIQEPYVEVNGNRPVSFGEQDLTTQSFEFYSELDALGRCGKASACIGRDIMPTEKRGSIGQVKPSGWHTVRYDCVDGKYLYNRCHLIGYQLAGENDNQKNLITGTRYLNVEGMLPFENLVADYVQETNHHVMYYVTPIYTETHLLADGVLLEGMSVEDQGKAVCFCVFCYNVQPGVSIDYVTGESSLEETISKQETVPSQICYEADSTYTGFDHIAA